MCFSCVPCNCRYDEAVSAYDHVLALLPTACTDSRLHAPRCLQRQRAEKEKATDLLLGADGRGARELFAAGEIILLQIRK